MMTNVMTKYTARQRISGYLSQHNGASAEEISLGLGLGAADIRHHLSILVEDGRVKVLGSRPETGRGRPVRIYGLGEAASRDNLPGLVDVLLRRSLEKAGEDQKEQILEEIAIRLVPIDNYPAGHVTRRLAQTVAQLNQLGYASRWEAHAAAPRILFDHCPYAKVIDKHPELCQLDRVILEKQLGGQVEQTAKLEKNARGTVFCQFVIPNPNSPKY